MRRGRVADVRWLREKALDERLRAKRLREQYGEPFIGATYADRLAERYERIAGTLEHYMQQQTT